MYLLQMANYFYFSNDAVILFKPWHTLTGLEMFGSCLLMFALTVGYEGLKILRELVLSKSCECGDMNTRRYVNIYIYIYIYIYIFKYINVVIAMHNLYLIILINPFNLQVVVQFSTHFAERITHASGLLRILFNVGVHDI